MEELARTREAERARGRVTGGGRRRWLVAATVAAAALALAVVAPLLGTGGNGSRAEAAELLRKAARVAAQQPPVSQADGYRYTKSEGAFLSTSGDGVMVSALVPVVREIWVAPNGSGRILKTEQDPIFFSPQDQQRWEDAGQPPLAEVGTSDESFGPGGLTYEDLESLPTDPDALFELIRSRAEHNEAVEAEMLVIVGDLLRESLAPPELRAALYEVAARIPGIELVEVTDRAVSSSGGVLAPVPAGRRAVAVAIESDYSGTLIRNELIFDPDTSEMFAERQVLLERVEWVDADPPALIGTVVYVNSGIVESTDDRP